ncbi:hypothetical protein CKO20_12860 [Rhodocyclus tenuis]|nr:hypothetical protein [Rhodocyclus tenuis]
MRSICNAGGVSFAAEAQALIGIRCFPNSNVIFRARPLQNVSCRERSMAKYFSERWLIDNG